MHLSVTTPGFWLVSVYMAAFTSLSASTTVPEAKLLPGFVVVLENAEKAPTPASEPAAPTTASVASALPARLFGIRAVFFILVESFPPSVGRSTPRLREDRVHPSVGVPSDKLKECRSGSGICAFS